MRTVAIPAMLALGACASGVPVERQTVVPGSGFEAVQGEARFTLRTFLPAEDGERREVIGADCTAVSSLYRASLVTPSELVVPNFGPQSPQIEVACTAGDLAGSGTARIQTRWEEGPGGWGYPWGPYGRPWGWGWGWGGPGYPVSSYPDLAITMSTKADPRQMPAGGDGESLGISNG